MSNYITVNKSDGLNLPYKKTHIEPCSLCHNFVIKSCIKSPLSFVGKNFAVSEKTRTSTDFLPIFVLFHKQADSEISGVPI